MVFGFSTSAFAANAEQDDAGEVAVESSTVEEEEIVQVPQTVHVFPYGYETGELGLGVDAGPRRLCVYDGRFYILDEVNYRIVILDGDDIVEVPLEQGEVLHDIYVDENGITMLYNLGRIVIYADPTSSLSSMQLAASQSENPVILSEYVGDTNACTLSYMKKNDVMARYETLTKGVAMSADSYVENFYLSTVYQTMEKELETSISNKQMLLQVDALGNRYYRGKSTASVGMGMVVETTVWKVASDGTPVASVVIPTQDMIYHPLVCLDVDENGYVYVMNCTKNGVILERYSLRAIQNSQLEGRCQERLESLAEAEMNTTLEETIIANPIVASTTYLTTTKTRAAVISAATSFTNYSWTVTTSNLYPETEAQPYYLVKALLLSDSATVTSIPYCFGKSHSLTQFAQYKNNGYYTGYTLTTSTASNTTGVDCSGLVAQCYGNTYYGTSQIPSYYDEVTMTAACKGDIILCRTSWGATSNHARLLDAVDSDGTWYTYESTITNSYDRVMH